MKGATMCKCTKKRKREVLNEELLTELNEYGLGVRLYEFYPYSSYTFFVMRIKLHGKGRNHSVFVELNLGNNQDITSESLRQAIREIEEWQEQRNSKTLYEALKDHTISQELAINIIRFYKVPEAV